ncbi:hypothetical protein V8E53_015533 [Lactarius tabidus]
MPRDPTNGRSKTYEALVKSLFTNMSHVKESDVPPRPQSRIGFRRNNKSFKTRQQPDRHVDDTLNVNSDEDTADSETSDEWSTDSDTSDSAFSSELLPPCFPAPSTPPPIPVPDAFPEQSPSVNASELPMPMHYHHRPMFPHHGLSRSALQHQKWLWNTRYDEWMQWRADVDSAEAAEMGAYGGITSPAAAAIEPPPPLRRCSRASSSPVLPESEYAPPRGTKTEMNEKIFPRTGDLTDLHDPQVVRLDQTFCNYPLWTIQKVLLVCSMDTTVLESEKTGSDDSQGCDKEGDTLAQRESESTIPLLAKLRWEQSWHTRWEVLTALVRMTERAVLARGRTTIPATVTTPIGLPVVARSLTDVAIESSATKVPTRFFLEDAERLAEVDGSESDDDEDDDDEDDYGEIILNPRFSLQRSVPDGCGLKRPILLPLDARRGVKALHS